MAKSVRMEEALCIKNRQNVPEFEALLASSSSHCCAWPRLRNPVGAQGFTSIGDVGTMMNEELEKEIGRLAGEAETVRPHEVDILELAPRLPARFPRHGEAEILEALKKEWRRRGLVWKA